MAIKDLIAKGIGFTPNTIAFIVTHGFGSFGIVSVTLNLVIPKMVQEGAVHKMVNMSIVPKKVRR